MRTFLGMALIIIGTLTLCWLCGGHVGGLLGVLSVIVGTSLVHKPE